MSLDVSVAALDSGIKYHRFHENFSHSIKANVIALVHLELMLKDGLTVQELKDKIYNTAELWGGMPRWKQPQKYLREARYDLACHGVVRVFSAFDVFLSEFEGEISSWQDFSKKRYSKPAFTEISRKASKPDDEKNEEEDVARCFRIMERFGWTLANEQLVKPLYRYYRLSRNCIAHRNAIVSPALAEASMDLTLQVAKSNWCRIMHEISEPPVKVLTAGKKMEFTHQDAIFCSSLSRGIALQVNKLAVDVMGLDGLVYFKTKKNVLNENTDFPITPGSNLTSLLADQLRQNNHIKGILAEDVKAALNELGLLQPSKDAFNEIKAHRFPKASPTTRKVKKRGEHSK
jgi:hypothetical protein